MTEHTPRPPLDLTIRAELDGWPLDLHFTLPAESVRKALARLGELGYTPRHDAGPAPAAAPAAPQRRPRAEPHYDAQGRPCCPTHGRELVEGKFGLYCPSKAAPDEAADKRGYCGLKFDA